MATCTSIRRERLKRSATTILAESGARTMPSIICWCTHTNGLESLLTLDVPRPPDVWKPSDASLCVRLLEMATASRDRSLEFVDAVRIHGSEQHNVVALEVEANAGVALTEPIHVPAVVVAWLDALADSFRNRNAVGWTVDAITAAVGGRLH
jgi:hypothetical protein